MDDACRVSAYLLHEHGSVPVFALPDRKEPVGAIPAHHAHTRVHVVKRYNDMVLVSGAEVRVPADGEAGGPLAVSGWMDRRVLRVGVEACATGDREPPTLYRRPDRSTAVDHTQAAGFTARVVGCRDTWWKVDDNRGHVGWVREGQWCDDPAGSCQKACD